MYLYSRLYKPCTYKMNHRNMKINTSNVHVTEVQINC